MQYKVQSYAQPQRWHEKSINSALFNKAGAGHAFSTCARHLDPGYNYNNNYNSFASGHIYIAARKQQLSALAYSSVIINFLLLEMETSCSSSSQSQEVSFLLCFS